jgi:RNA polymerase sigma-70 factor (ECF subfamily)
MNSVSGDTDASTSGEDRHERFVRLLSAAHDRLVAFLASLLGNRFDAEDVFQQASVTMWRKFDTFKPGTNFDAWAAKVAFYESREFRRLKARERFQFSDTLLETLAEERLPDLEHTEARIAALEHCMGKLDDSGRALVEAAYFEEGSILTLAAQLGRAPQTLYNKLNLLRRMLAECIERRLMEASS